MKTEMMKTELSIPTATELKSYDVRQLNSLASALRARLIEVTSVNGGHLASSLGAVEIILALHAAYDLPADKLIFDVGHQSYAHKLLTGRNEAFSTLRSFGGLSGFTRREESPYDTHDSGHASDSLSIALGLALARDIDGRDEQVVALIGDAAISGGMAFEALNQIGQAASRLTIVLNDNEMSISRNVGALSLHLAKARVSKPYTALRDTVEDRLGSTGQFGRVLVNAGEAVKGSVKKLVVPGTFFEEMGITYVGPIDGHNIGLLIEALRVAKNATKPVLIHAITQKGRGYIPAERRPEVFHGIGGYDPQTGQVASGAADAPPTFTSVFSQALLAEAQANPDIVAITAAMTDGTGLTTFRTRYPDRVFDVGIAEEHAVALAAGLSLAGKLPVVAVYSTFLQRAFDQLITNVALQKQHCVFAVDRAGLVGEDGTTHHGLFDLAYLRQIPGMRLIAPADAQQLQDALHTALVLKDGPVAIRYPRGETPVPREDRGALDGCGPMEGPVCQPESLKERVPQILSLGKALCLREGGDISLLALGRMVAPALELADRLAEHGLKAAVYNMLWVKPLDCEALRQASAASLLVTLEEGTTVGGFGSAVLEALAANAFSPEAGVAPSQPKVLTIGIPDCFVTHGSTELLFADLGLDVSHLLIRIQDAWNSAQTT